MPHGRRTRPTTRRADALTLVSLEPRDTPAAVGQLDPGFGAGGKLVTDFGGVDRFSAVAVQPDGKIVAAGTNGSDVVVVRTLVNGATDPSFGANGRQTIDFGGADKAHAVLVDAVGRVLVAGTNGIDMAVARLAPNGQLDSTFSGDGKQTVNITGGDADVAFTVALDAVNRVLLGGTSDGDFAVARLTADGANDTSFNGTGNKFLDLGGTEDVRGVVVQGDGRLVLVGSTTSTSGVSQDFVAVRLSADGGTTDTTFGNKSVTVAGNTVKVAAVDFGGVDRLTSVAKDTKGRFVLAGTSGGNFAVARVDANFALDPGLNATGTALVNLNGTEVANAVYVQADGKIVIAGTTTATGSSDFAVVRMNDNGTFDTTFNTVGSSVVNVGGVDEALAAAPDLRGRVVLAGVTGNDAALARLSAGTDAPQDLLVSGPGDGLVRPYAVQNGQYVASTAFNAFPGTAGGGRVAAADVTGDGVVDRVIGNGPGAPPQVVIYDGATGRLVANFLAFAEAFTGGVYVAAADVTGDGQADVVVTPDLGGGPVAVLYDGAVLAAGGTGEQAEVIRFFGIADPDFRGGARPALGDVNADGTPDLAVSAGFLGGPRIALWNGTTLKKGATPVRLVNDFFAFDIELRNGAFVAIGDLNADGFGEMIFGGGPGGGPRVRVFDGKQLMANPGVGSVEQLPAGAQLANFFAGDVGTRGGIHLAVRDYDGDGQADLVTGSGERVRSEVRVYKATTLRANPAAPTPDQVFDPFGLAPAYGVFVG